MVSDTFVSGANGFYEDVRSPNIQQNMIIPRILLHYFVQDGGDHRSPATGRFILLKNVKKPVPRSVPGLFLSQQDVPDRTQSTDEIRRSPLY